MSNEISVNLEKAISEISKYYQQNPYKPPLRTLPEIFRRQRHENFISDWIAYLLDPKENGFGIEPLRKLCEHFDFGNYISDADSVEVQREKRFRDGKRIDVYIKISRGHNNLLLVGIENKIDAPESDNQTAGYHKRLKEICRKEGFKELLPIYLYAGMQGAEKPFENLTYQELKELFGEIPYDIKRDARKNFYFYEFILYVEEILMDTSKNCELTPAASLYMKNKNDIENAKAEFENYADKFDDDLAKKIMEKAFASEADDVYRERRRAGEYMQFFKITWVNEYKKKRDEYGDFYYEILYDNKILNDNGSKTKKRLCELDDEDKVRLWFRFPDESVMRKYGEKEEDLSRKEVCLNLKTEPDKAIKEIVDWITSPEIKKITDKLELKIGKDK